MKTTCPARRAMICLGILTSFALTAFLSSCGDSSSSIYHTPKFVVAVNSTNGQNLEVFPVNANDGTLGTEVSGAAFDLNVNLANPYAVATHPTHGNWVYICDWNASPFSQVVAVSVGADGTPRVTLPTVNTSTRSGCDYTYSMTITPNGKYLYTADLKDDPDGVGNVSMFAIDQTTGALTSLGTIATGLSDSDAITATNNFVFVDSSSSNQIATLKINSDGTLSCPTSGCPIKAETTAIFAAMGVDRSDKFLYATSRDAQLYGYKIGSDGSLTPLSSMPTLSTSAWFYQVSFSLDNTSMYVADDQNGVLAFSFNSTSGAVGQVTAYPNSNGYAESVVVAPSDTFVYSDDGSQGIFGWKRDENTGALTSIGAPAQPLATSTAGNISAISVTY